MRAANRRFFTTEAIVVRARDLGEADRIVVVLTPNRGLVSCVARGARRTTSRTGGHVDLLRHVRLSINESRSSDLHTINQAEPIDTFLGIRSDINRLGLASHMAEICERASLPSAPHPELFELLRVALGLVESISVTDLPKLQLWHEMRVLHVSGFAPELHSCTRTGDELPPGDHWFSASDGGVVMRREQGQPVGRDAGHPSSGTDRDEVYSSPLLPARMNVIKLLRFVANSSHWNVVESLTVGPDDVTDALRLTSALLMHVQDRGPGRAQRVMDEMGDYGTG